MSQPPAGPLLRSLLASTLRGWRGTQSLRAGSDSATSLTLFDRENEPDCRLLRELLTELQLDAQIRPCPIGGRRFLRRRPRGSALPCLLDAEHQVVVSGLQACAKHLLTHYAKAGWATGLLTSWPMRLSSRLASRVRGKVGEVARPSRLPRKPLQLYSFESSPYSRLVRERLCELELPWILRNFGKEQLSDWGPPGLRFSLKPWQAKSGGLREHMLKAHGQAQVPLLIDPNQGVELFESSAILAHLERHYAR